MTDLLLRLPRHELVRLLLDALREDEDLRDELRELLALEVHDKPTHLTVPEAARRCGLSPKTVRRSIEDGELPAFRVRGRVLLAVEDVDAWVAAGRVGQRERSSLPARLPRGSASEGLRSLL